MLAIIYTLKKHKYVLMRHPVYAHTDDRALEFLYSNANEGRMARWRIYLRLFDLQSIQYVPGNANKVADALSCLIQPSCVNEEPPIIPTTMNAFINSNKMDLSEFYDQLPNEQCKNILWKKAMATESPLNSKFSEKMTMCII